MPSLARIADPFHLLAPTTRLVTDAGLALLARALATQTALDAVDVVLRSPAAQRAVRTAIDGPLADAGTARLLAGRNLWLVVEEVASSPMVAQAIARQGAGFADQVADEAVERTQRADDRLERAARRLLHRRPPPPEAAGGPFAPPRAP